MMRPILNVLLVGLLGSALVGCRTSDGLRRDYLESIRPLLDPPSRPVIIIPGFGVSRLYDPVDEQWVWGTPRTTVITSYRDDLDLPVEAGRGAADRLEARGFVGSRGPVNTAWQLAIALQKYGRYRIARWSDAREVRPTAYLFEYDWRQSAFESAKRLDELIEQVRTDYGDPGLEVDLLTHSAGANVALAYLGGNGATGEKTTDARRGASQKVASLVMVAPPRRGTLEAFKLLVRGEQVIRRRFDPAMSATWPAVFEVLPHAPIVLIDERGNEKRVDPHRLESWKSQHLGLFDRKLSAAIRSEEGEEGWARRVAMFERYLEDAEAFARVVETPVSGEVKVLTILGDCVPTARRVLRRSDGTVAFYPRELKPDERRLFAVLFGTGDGTVGAASAEPPDGEGVLRLCSGHQGLAMDPATHRAILRAFLE